MCYYQKLRENKRYRANKKNGGRVPRLHYNDLAWVPTTCGKCRECRMKKARDWQVRLLEHIKDHKNGKMITLTLNTKSLQELTEDARNNQYINGKMVKSYIHYEGYLLDNKIATRAVYRFCERWRKEIGKAPHRWLITELGHENTEHIHLHGIIWTDESFDTIRRIWKYGFMYPYEKEDQIRNNVNAKAINYNIKYVHKVDKKHKHYKQIILCSNGIGKGYTKRHNSKTHKYKGKDTILYYITETGHKVALPKYLKEKVLNEYEREMLWLHQIEKKVRYVNGKEIDISKGTEHYDNAIKQARKINNELGYGSEEYDMGRAEYEHKKRVAIQKKRLQIQ